jgi:hypothetical protein
MADVLRMRPQVRDFSFQFCTNAVHVQKIDMLLVE